MPPVLTFPVKRKPLLFICCLFSCCLLTPTAWAQSYLPGRVNFSRLANSSLDPFTDSAGAGGQIPSVSYQPGFNGSRNPPTPLANRATAQQQWFVSRFDRMTVFSPYFDNMTSWYLNAQVYQDLYAIYPGSAVASQHPEWILHDQQGNQLYIPWGCSDGTCPQYAADIANPKFRAWWIRQVQSILSRGGYRGIWIDDVNMNFAVSDGNANPVAPMDDSTAAPMTWAAWRSYVAQFVTQIRQAFPGREIVHNPVWYAGPPGVLDQDPSIQAEIAAADIINLERGIGSEPNLTGGTGFWSLDSFFGYIDRVHQAGHGVVLEQYDVTDVPTQEYSMAGYFLISSGVDYYADTSTTPANWWSGFNVNMGVPLGPRSYNNGIYQRNFSQGIVLLGEPGAITHMVALPGVFQRLDGTRVGSVTISAREGIILLGPYYNPVIPALSATTTSLPPATSGVFYDVGLTASGGSGAYSFSLSGAPAGLAISGWRITGTPSTAGTYNNVSLTVRDTATGAQAGQTLSLTVH